MSPPSFDDELTTLSDADLEETRQRLRIELSTIAHWRRLVRARVDLTIAQATPPAQLGARLHEFMTLSAHTTAQISAVSDKVLTAHTMYSVTDLPELKHREVALSDYERAIRRALMNVTNELVARHTQPPH